MSAAVDTTTAFDRIVSEAVRAGSMVGGPTMAPVAKPVVQPATTSTPTQVSQPVVQRLVPPLAPQPERADTHHGALLLGVGIGVAITFAVFVLSGRSS